MVNGDLGFFLLRFEADGASDSDWPSSLGGGAEGPEGMSGLVVPDPIMRRNEPVNAGTDGGGCLARERRGFFGVTTVMPLRDFDADAGDEVVLLSGVALTEDVLDLDAVFGVGFVLVVVDVVDGVFLVFEVALGVVVFFSTFLTDLLVVEDDFFVLDALDALRVELVAVRGDF